MIPIFILNLERSPDRKEKLQQQLDAAGVTDYHFFPAYDGRHITNLTFNANIGVGYGAGRQFQKAELAIIMSHIAVIRHAMMMEYDQIIVLEDDVALCEDWDDRLTMLFKQLPRDWEYVYLSGHSDYIQFKQHSTPIVEEAPPMVGAFSYMVNKSAYSKIVKQCTSFMTTYDDMIMNLIQQKKMKGHIYFPFMTYHNAETSLIWGVTAKEHSSKTFFKNKL